MKTILTILLGMAVILMGTYFIVTNHESLSITVGSSLILVGFGTITYLLTREIGKIKPKIYRFMHLYDKIDTLSNDSEIVKELGKEDITQLQKKYRVEDIKLLFRNNPILIESIENVRIGVCSIIKVVGWVYGANEDEVLRTLHYEQFGDTVALEEPNTDEEFDFYDNQIRQSRG
jgi:hypothetical protein